MCVLGAPMKADHTISVPAAPGVVGAVGRQLSRNRPPSVGSVTGGPGDLDENLYRLDREYTGLMDKYRKLKQMRATEERDEEVTSLLGVSYFFLKLGFVYDCPRQNFTIF